MNVFVQYYVSTCDKDIFQCYLRPLYLMGTQIAYVYIQIFCAVVLHEFLDSVIGYQEFQSNTNNF